MTNPEKATGVTSDFAVAAGTQFSRVNLLAALRQVRDELAYLRKEGRATQGQSYAYARESDVKREFRRAFARAGIDFTGSEVSSETKPHRNKEDKPSGYLTHVVLEFRLTHVDSGETLTARCSGHGYDSTDKGVGKAWSYAVKTWLLNSFLIETGEDSEKDEDDQALDRDLIADTFKKLASQLKACEPKKNMHKDQLAELYSHYHTASGHMVQDPREFDSRADALACLAAGRQVVKFWEQAKLERESDARQPDEGLGVSAADIPGLSKKDFKAAHYPVVREWAASHGDVAEFLAKYEGPPEQALAEALEWDASAAITRATVRPEL